VEIFQYYGCDWLVMIFTFLATYQLGSKHRYGFITMMAANICWATLGILTGSIAMLIANIIIFCMNLRAYIRW